MWYILFKMYKDVSDTLSSVQVVTLNIPKMPSFPLHVSVVTIHSASWISIYANFLGNEVLFWDSSLNLYRNEC